MEFIGGIVAAIVVGGFTVLLAAAALVVGGIVIVVRRSGRPGVARSSGRTGRLGGGAGSGSDRSGSRSGSGSGSGPRSGGGSAPSASTRPKSSRPKPADQARLSKRRWGWSGGSGQAERASDDVRRRAGSALVRADTRIGEGESDVEFAVAQFGERAAQDYRAALRRAHADRDEIFRMHRLIDDDPDAGLANRERANRIVMLADRIDRSLGEQAVTFRDRRALESTAADRLLRLTVRITEARLHLGAITVARDSLLSSHARPALGTAVDAPERAARSLDRAEVLAVHSAPGISAPASSVMSTIAEAERLLFSAEDALESVDAAAQRLSAAGDALRRLRVDARIARAAALEVAASAPDGDSGVAIAEAVAQLDRAAAAGPATSTASATSWTSSTSSTSASLSTDDTVDSDETVESDGTAENAGPESATGFVRAQKLAGTDARPAPAPASNPLEQLDDLREAMDAVEVSLAASRMQGQRLAQAREAYHAARVQTESQLVVARDAVAAGRSAGARARLDDAVDELRASRAMFDTDPVGALDAVRRALTHARDAEVLARY